MKHQKVVLCLDFTFYLFAFFILPLGDEFFYSIPCNEQNLLEASKTSLGKTK